MAERARASSCDRSATSDGAGAGDGDRGHPRIAGRLVIGTADALRAHVHRCSFSHGRLSLLGPRLVAMWSREVQAQRPATEAESARAESRRTPSPRAHALLVASAPRQPASWRGPGPGSPPRRRPYGSMPFFSCGAASRARVLPTLPVHVHGAMSLSAPISATDSMLKASRTQSRSAPTLVHRAARCRPTPLRLVHLNGCAIGTPKTLG